MYLQCKSNVSAKRMSQAKLKVSKYMDQIYYLMYLYIWSKILTDMFNFQGFKVPEGFTHFEERTCKEKFKWNKKKFEKMKSVFEASMFRCIGKPTQ